MYKIMSVWDMQEAFKAFNRENYFSDEGLEAIDNSYMECCNEIVPLGCEIEFDVIAISCDWNEYGNGVVLSFDDFINDFGYLLESEFDYLLAGKEFEELEKEEKINIICEALESKTYCVRLENGNILQMIF